MKFLDKEIINRYMSPELFKFKLNKKEIEINEL